MTNITQPDRLRKLYAKIEAELQKNQQVLSQSVVVTAAGDETIERLLDAAARCATSVSDQIETEGRLTSSQRKNFAAKAARVREPLTRKSQLAAGQNYRSLIGSTPVQEALEDLHCQFEALGITEAFDDGDLKDLAQKILDLQSALLASSLDPSLRLHFARILTRMHENVVTYNELGEQQLQSIVEQWSGALLMYNDILAKQGNEEVRSGSGRLFVGLWKKIRKTSGVLQIAQSFEWLASSAKNAV